MGVMTEKCGLGGRCRLAAAAACSAALVCLLIYLRTMGNDFVYLDDPTYVYNNPDIRRLDWGVLASAFTRLFAGDYWMPLTWISYAVDYRFWGVNPAGYHLTNSVLHAVNVGLVVLIADRLAAREEMPGVLYGMILLFAGLLWGIHPLRVESVAWVMARKDVLNGAFSLGSVLLYLGYVQRRSHPGTGDARRYYAASLTLFICSLMAKPVSVVLPAMLLVTDWYPLGRLNKETAARLLMEKLPFLACSAAVTVVTILAKMQYGGLQSAESLPLTVRTVLSGNAVFEYVLMCLWPVGIIPFYPLPKPIPTLFIVKTGAIVLATVTLLFQARKRPGLAAPWLCFLVLLLPVLAFMHNGIDIALAPRFTYLAAVVPSVVAAAVLAGAAHKYDTAVFRMWRRGVAALIAVLVLWYAGITLRLIDTWEDTEAMWTRQIEVLPLGRAYNARGHYYMIRDRYPEALRDFSTALDIAARAGQPFVDNILAFRGETRYLSGDFEGAVADFSAAIALNPHPRYFSHRGRAQEALGRLKEAEGDYVRSGGDSGPIVWFAQGGN